MIKNSSIGKYSNKKYNRPVRSAVESLNAEIIEEMAYQKNSAGVNDL